MAVEKTRDQQLAELTDQTISQELEACGVWWHKWTRHALALALLVLMAFAWRAHSNLKNEYRLRSALMAVAQDSASAFVLVDETGRVTTWSRGAEEMFGITAEQAVGGDMSPVIPPGMRATHREQFTGAVARGGVKDEKVVIRCDAIGRRGATVPVVITIRSVPHHKQGLLFLAEINHAEQVRTADLTAAVTIGGDL